MVRVMLADPQAVVRIGVKTILEAEKDFEVVAECESGLDVCAMAARHRPDVCILEVTLPGRNGVDLAPSLHALPRSPRVLILSSYVKRQIVVGAFQAGVDGYAVKTIGPSMLREAVRAVARGQSFISPEIADVVLQHAVGGVSPAREKLTPRERQVLQMLAEGMNAKQVAAEIGISDKTVHAFRAQVMRKLGLRSVAGLTKYAIRHGLTSLA